MKSVRSSASRLASLLFVLLSLSSPSAQAQEAWSELNGWVHSAPRMTSDHYDGLQDRAVPEQAQYCWVANAGKNLIGVAFSPEGTFFGILYSSIAGYDLRTSHSHVIQKSNSTNRTEVNVQTSNGGRSGSIRFRRTSTGITKEVPFRYGPCPASRVQL